MEGRSVEAAVEEGYLSDSRSATSGGAFRTSMTCKRTPATETCFDKEARTSPETAFSLYRRRPKGDGGRLLCDAFVAWRCPTPTRLSCDAPEAEKDACAATLKGVTPFSPTKTTAFLPAVREEIATTAYVFLKRVEEAPTVGIAEIAKNVAFLCAFEEGGREATFRTFGSAAKISRAAPAITALANGLANCKTPNVRQKTGRRLSHRRNGGIATPVSGTAKVPFLAPAVQV